MNGISVYRYLDSPVGKLLVAGKDEVVQLISFPDGKTAIRPDVNWDLNEVSFHDCVTQLQSYFSGENTQFNFAMKAEGTQFQKLVWQALCDIPYGTTQSYGDIAVAIGKPKAVRAVGAANGANPLPIVVPCHRVIGANSSMTGFGGGIETKKILLRLENVENLQGELF